MRKERNLSKKNKLSKRRNWSKKRIVRELKASGGPAGTGKGAAPFKGPRKPTRPKPTPPSRNKKSMGGRTNYKSGGAAKRGRGCEIK